MNSNIAPALLSAAKMQVPVSEKLIAQLVGQVYAAAPPAEQSRLLEHLLRPLGVLSLACAPRATRGAWWRQRRT